MSNKTKRIRPQCNALAEVVKALEITPSLLNDSSRSADDNESDEVDFIVIQRFQYWEYLMGHETPYEFEGCWQKETCKDQLGLSKKHLNKIIHLAQTDSKNLDRNLRHLNKISPNLRLVLDSGGVQFDGLTKKQMRECSEIEELSFELLETE